MKPVANKVNKTELLNAKPVISRLFTKFRQI